MISNILTIAGSDPSGGAGIQADLKTIGALGGYGMSVITALTAQNTQGVSDLHNVPVDFVGAQIDAVFSDVRIDAVKTGMINDVDIVRVIVSAIKRYQPAHVVVDPVMVAQSGDVLCCDDVVALIRDELFPLADVVTPNIPEAEVLLARTFDEDMESFADDLLTMGMGAVMLKGGHNKGAQAVDIYTNSTGVHALSAPWVETNNNHGTGCSLASAMATKLAQGASGIEAARAAKAYVHGALMHADQLDVGRGAGPTQHFWAQSDG